MVPIPERFAIRRTLCAATTALPVLAYALVCLPAAAQTLTQSAAQSTNSSTLPGSTFNGGLGIGVPQNTALGGGLVNLRDLVDSPVLQGQERQFQWNASIAAYAGYTDNVGQSGGGYAQGNQIASTEEHITPSIGVTMDANHLTGSLTYSPDFRFYNDAPRYNRISQNLGAQALATLVEDQLFVQATAGAGPASASPLSTYNNNRLISNQSQTQVYSYSIMPYLVHRFGDFATLRASYAYSGSTFDNSAYNNTVPNNANARLNNSGSATQTEDVQLTSGADFETFNHALEASSSQFLGGGSERGGYRNSVTYTLNYALNRFITLIGTIGYESVHYSGTNIGGVQTSRDYSSNGLIGQAGVKYTPNEDSDLSVLYGHIDGGDSLTATGNLRPTGRLSLSLTSSTALTTNGQDASFGGVGSLNGGGLGAPSGVPTAYGFGAYGANNQLYRLTRTSGSAIYALDRDSFGLTLSYSQTSSPNATAAGVKSGLVAGSSTNSLASLTWQHTLTEDISSSVGVNYGQSRYNGRSQPISGATVRVSDQINQSLSAQLLYTYAREQGYLRSQFGAVPSNQVQSSNEVLVGLIQTF